MIGQNKKCNLVFYCDSKKKDIARDMVLYTNETQPWTLHSAVIMSLWMKLCYSDFAAMLFDVVQYCSFWDRWTVLFLKLLFYVTMLEPFWGNLY